MTDDETYIHEADLALSMHIQKMQNHVMPFRVHRWHDDGLDVDRNLTIVDRENRDDRNVVTVAAPISVDVEDDPAEYQIVVHEFPDGFETVVSFAPNAFDSVAYKREAKENG